MKRLILSIILFLFIHKIAEAQCPSAGFTTSNSVCAGQPIIINNSSTGATNYEWDFCAGDFSTVPSAADDPSNPSGPVSISVVFDGTNWYGFIANTNSHVLRYDFGTSLDNIPAGPTDLGNPGNIISGGFFNEISFRFESAHWYAIFAAVNGYKIVTLDFDSTLANPNPVASSFTNPLIPSGLAMQDIKTDHDSIFLFVGNDATAQLLRFSYGTSILNPPVTDTILLPGYSNMEDIALVKTCNHWYGYGVSYSSNTILKFDFGNSLSNRPVVSDFGNPGNTLSHPYSIVIANDGLQWVAFIMNYTGGLIKINMGNNIGNPLLSATPVNLPGINGLGTTVNMAKEGSSYFLFPSGYLSGKFSKIKYASPCSAVPQTSTDPVPSNIIYTSSGTFNIQLQATDASGNIDYHTDSITVNYAPVSNFSFSNTCFGNITAFIDSSTIISSGSIVSRHWDFGDGDTVNILNPTHIYLATGTYSVSLTATANNGCTNSKILLVTISPNPVANFSAPPECSETSIQFTDLSTIASGTITTWSWQFGNSDSSVDSNPVYAYSTGGNYQATLQVTSDAGCTDTASFMMNIPYRPLADFDATNTCIGQSVQFTDLTVSQSPIQSYHWDFGNTDTSNIANPSYSYAAVIATYTVGFIVEASNGCIDTTTQLIKINNVPTPNFSYSPSNVCEANNVSFTDLSVVAGDTISGWLWNFGDAHTDTVQNPVHKYLTAGVYTVILTAYSPSSCGNSFSQNVTVIQSPSADFSATDVCFGATTQFTDQSTSPTGSSITNWYWDFGDSTTDTIQNPSHIFQTPGNHLVTLTVTTNFGCTNTFSLSAIVHHLPVASFVNTIPCTINAVQFNNTSTIDPSSTITNYSWNFGNPSSGNDTSTIPNPTHLFDTTGSFVVSLITTSNFGCMDTAYNVLNVQQAAHADFQYSPTCFGDLVHFTDLTLPTGLDTAWVWNFGDGTYNNLQNPAHFYSSPGTYSVTLTVTAHGSGCVTPVTKQVAVSPIPVADFHHIPACINTPYQFIDSSHVSTGNIVTWKWNFAGLDSSSLQNPLFTFPDTGNYIIRLTVTSDIGCTNTLTRTIHVYPLPVANFNFNPPFGSPPLDVTFTNLTTGGSTYEWNFGDGSAISNLINPQHLFTDTNLFAVQLIATSQYGCKDTIVKNIYVIQPVLDIAITNVSSYVLDNHLHIIANLANLGTRTINNFKMEAQIENGTPIQESYVEDLPNGFSGQIELTTAFDLGAGNSKYYCVRAVKPNGTDDDNPSNNEICKSLTKEFSVINPYPNPFNDHLTLQMILPYKDNISIELYDMIGKKIMIYEGEGHEGLNQFDADLSGLAAGSYAVRFTFRDSDTIKTIVKTDKKK